VGLRRKVNEDALLVRTPRALWVVADGMGGHDAGEVASAMVVEALSHLPLSENIEGATANALAALEQVNEALIAMAHSDGRSRTIGSTVVGLLINNGRFRCFWAGDSRAYRLRGGEITQITRDHSLVQDLVDAKMLSPEEADHHPNANVITRAVGIAEKLVVEISSGDVKAGDQFLLASDGLTRVVDDREMLQEIGAGALEAAADKLLETVLARGAPDNVSLIIIEVN
jgi:serine/threonine protein phosphatase PrpC